jgi:hypothetical protein
MCTVYDSLSGGLANGCRHRHGVSRW